MILKTNIYFKNIISYSNNFLQKLFKQEEGKYLLGRWCHINIPNCNNNVILKKIDFANGDNNLCYKNLNMIKMKK